MKNYPQTTDLHVFVEVSRHKSFNRAADALGVSAAYVSKRIQLLEKNLGETLLHRNTRHVSLTAHGQIVLEWASRIVAQVETMTDRVKSEAGAPHGLLHITSSLGFGRVHVAPLLSEFIRCYPHIRIRFDTIDVLPSLHEQRIDVDIRIGNEFSPELHTRKLAANRRILCAAPAYLARFRLPETLHDLASHECLIIKERDHPFGLWQLRSQSGAHDVRVSGSLASNNGEMVRLWALAGHGVMLRSWWDVASEIQTGALIHVLPDYWQPADIWAVFTERPSHSAKLRACVEFFASELPKRLVPEKLPKTASENFAKTQ